MKIIHILLAITLALLAPKAFANPPILWNGLYAKIISPGGLKFSDNTIQSSASAGNVAGSASSLDNEISVFDGTTGKLLKQSGGILSNDAVNVYLNAGEALTDPDNGKNLVISAGNTFQDGFPTGVAGSLRLQGGLEADTINRGKIYIDGELNALLGAKFVNGITTNVLNLTDGDSSDYVRLFAPAVTTQYDIIFPPAQGAANTFLKNDGTGALSWVSSGSGDVVGPASSLDNELPVFDSTTGKLLKQSGATLRNDGSNVFLTTPDSPARGLYINSSNGVAANGSGSILEIRSGDATQDSGTGLPGTLVIGTGLTSDAGSRGDIFLDGFLQMQYKATATAGMDFSSIAPTSLGGIGIDLKDTDNSDKVNISPAAVTTGYNLTLPAAQGASNTFLKNDGSGGLTWGNAANSACTYKVATTTGTSITATCTGSNYPVSGGCSTAGAGVLASSASDPAPTDGQAADVPTGWSCTYTISGSITAYALCCTP